jgi:hypothetical protein
MKVESLVNEDRELQSMNQGMKANKKLNKRTIK